MMLGFPARLVIPGYYGTNCVKWICRMALMRRRPSEFQTIRLYGDPGSAGDAPGTLGKPVWAVRPVEVSVDGGRSWIDARVEPAAGQSWQRFSVSWSPCRATDTGGRTQPIDRARNAVHSVDVMVAD